MSELLTHEGLDLAALCQSTWRAMNLAAQGVGLPVSDWELLTDDRRRSWEEAVHDLVGWLSQCEGAFWTTLASRFLAVYTGGPVTFASLSLRERVLWEAVVRHLANLLALQEGDEVAGHENHWTTWASARLAKETSAR